MTSIRQVTMPIIIVCMLLAVGAKAQSDGTIKTELLWQENVAPDADLYGVQFSPTDKYIITGGGQAHYIVDAKTGKKIIGINNNIIMEDGVWIRTSNYPRFIYNDTIMLLESEDKHTVNFHTFPDLKVIASLESTDGQIITYDVSQDQKLLIADVEGQKLVLWDLETKKIIKEKKIEKFQGEKESNLSLPVFVPKHQQITVNTFHTYVTGHSPKPPFEITKTIGMKNVLNYSLDSISNWDAYAGEGRYFYSKDGKYFARMYSGEINGINQWIIYIYDYDTKKLVNKVPTGVEGTVGNYFITPDDKYLMMAAGMSAVYSIETGKQVHNFHLGTCMGGTISNKGDEVAFSLNENLFKFSFSENTSVHQSSGTNYLKFDNPIKFDTKIILHIGIDSKITLNLTDERGKLINTLCNQFYTSGEYAIDFKISNIPNGLYFLTLTDENGNTDTHKIIIER